MKDMMMTSGKKDRSTQEVDDEGGELNFNSDHLVVIRGEVDGNVMRGNGVRENM